MDLNKLLQICEGFSENKVDSKLCCHKISKKSNCQLCVDNCPVNGIAIDEGQVHIEQCVRCGTCVALCPNHVFYLGNEKALFKQQENGILILSCIHKYKELNKKEQDQVNAVYCLKQLYPELVLALLQQHRQIHIIADTDQCRDCLQFDPANLISKLAAYPFSLDNLHFITQLPTKQTKKSTAAGVDTRKRSLFRSLFTQTKNASVQTLGSALESYGFLDSPSAPRQYLPLKRQYLVQAAKKLSDPEAVLPLPVPQVRDCVFCGACVQLCPFQALKINREGVNIQLLFSPSQCTACGICEDVCLFQGITLEGTLTVEELLDPAYQTLVSTSLQKCPHCGNSYAYVGNHPQCPSCDAIEKTMC